MTLSFKKWHIHFYRFNIILAVYLDFKDQFKFLYSALEYDDLFLEF